MRSCLSGAECELKETDKLNHHHSKNHEVKKCGMDIAYIYFVSFVFFSSFLVILFY
jgi:hypothetical protein